MYIFCHKVNGDKQHVQLLDGVASIHLHDNVYMGPCDVISTFI